MRKHLSLIESLLEYERQRQNEKWPSGNEENIKEFINFIKTTQKSLKIVSGELSPNFYERSEVLSEYKRILNNGGIIEMIFNKDEEESKMMTLLREQNPNLLALVREYDRLKLYWTPKRPKQHYAISDKRHLFFEEPDHPSGADRYTLFRYNDPKLGEEWEKRFDLYKGRCKEIM